MLSFLNPVDINVEFPQRDYTLGGTIDLVVTIKGRSDIQVTQGRVELTCRERFHEVHTVMVPVSRPVPPPRLGAARLPTFRVPKRVAEEFKSTSVHSSVVFLQGAHLARGSTEVFSVSLDVGSQLPPYADKNSIMRWRLVTAIDMDDGRTIAKEKRIAVTW